MKHLLLALLLCLPLAASPSDAQDVTVQRVPAPGGVVDTRLAGLIIGYQSISYVVSMARGQALSVALTASNNATYFNVYGPGSGPGGQALLNSGTTRPANRGQITAQRGGDYTINVYLTREAARRLETSLFGLSVAVRGSAATDRPPRPST